MGGESGRERYGHFFSVAGGSSNGCVRLYL
jgi:hypothetical protein